VSSSAPLVTHNGFTENGLSTNGFTENGFTENGFTENGFTENGFTENGFTENGFTENGFTENGMSALDIMANDPNAIEFAQYAYSCALPPGKHLTLTINGSAVNFDGQLGLAPEWETGPCNDDCKRWVSACLLARVNKYGEHVQLSLRAPRAQFLADGDMDAYERTKYLELVTDPDPTLDESTLFPLREGAYFGNVFDTEAPGGILLHAPKYYACAGPASSIPQLTNRFCSGQGDDCVIFTGSESTWHDCLTGPRACAGLDTLPGANGGAPSNAVRGCVSPDGATPYKEVLTVYLAHPNTICGNGICEGQVLGAIYGDGAVPEDSTTCPQDCHPGTWAKAVDLIQPNPCIAETCLFSAQNGSMFDPGRRVTVGAGNSLVRILDQMPGSGPGIDFGTEDGPLAASPGIDSLLAVYNSLGTPAVSKQLALAPDGTHSRSVTTDPAGNIVLVTYNPIAVTKFDVNGAQLWRSTAFPAFNTPLTAGPVATDSAGNVFVAWSTTINLAAGSVTVPGVSKFLPADGTADWVLGLQGTDPNVFVEGGAMATDAAGNIYLTDVGNIYKIIPTGQQAWSKAAQDFGGLITFTGLTSDADGNVYAAGRTTDTANFDPTGATPTQGPGLFVVKFSQPDGTFSWTYHVAQTAVAFSGFTNMLAVEAIALPPPLMPVDVHIDSDGNVVVAGGFRGNGLVPNFGPGAFDSEGSPDTFIVALSPSNGQYVWAKSMPLYSGGGTDGITVGTAGQVFVTGGFDASMLIDSAQLINTHPERVNSQNLFVGAFKAPCGTPGCDVIAPFFDPGTVPGATVPTGNRTRVGNPIIVYATSQAGALVHYTLPLASNALGDPNYDGANIVCNPRTGSTFPIGVTTVTCSANDPHGNTSTTTFPITVLGTSGPVLLNVPGDMTLDATNAAGIVVNYTLPTSKDLIDGDRPVSCSPASGSTFPVGTTTVDCTSTDLNSPAPNVTHGKFTVKVRFQGPPVITVPPNGVSAEATTVTGTTVTYQASAKDGLGNPIPVSCTPPSGSFFGLGQTTVTCTATDSFGNTASKSFKVTVTFHWFGFKSPISNTGISQFNQGSTIPVKFTLRRGIENAVAHLFVAKIENGTVGAEQPAVASGTSNQGNLFRFDDCDDLYIFNMSTTNMSKGQWRLRVDLHDGEVHTVTIKLK
jgi:hypothetical protein